MVIALIVGIIQGIFEWLPISSQGNITIALTLLERFSSTDAVTFALFLHAGTAVSATAYYRDELEQVMRSIPDWHPRSAFGGSTAELSYLGIATIMTGIIGLPAYYFLNEVISGIQGGVFIALVGLLLIATGVLQRVSGDLSLGKRDQPNMTDAVLVGALQGLAVLPGVSRSGVTASALLFRSHDGPSAFRLSFLLSIPAAIGGSALSLVEAGGLPAISPGGAVIALAMSAIIGYLTIDALMRVVERVSFWKICLGLGALAVLGGGLLFVEQGIGTTG